MNIGMNIIMTIFRYMSHHGCAWTIPQLHLEPVDKFIEMIVVWSSIWSLFQQVDQRCAPISIQVMANKEPISFQVAGHVCSRSMIANTGGSSMRPGLVSC